MQPDESVSSKPPPCQAVAGLQSMVLAAVPSYSSPWPCRDHINWPSELRSLYLAVRLRCSLAAVLPLPHLEPARRRRRRSFRHLPPKRQMARQRSVRPMARWLLARCPRPPPAQWFLLAGWRPCSRSFRVEPHFPRPQRGQRQVQRKPARQLRPLRERRQARLPQRGQRVPRGMLRQLPGLRRAVLLPVQALARSLPPPRPEWAQRPVPDRAHSPTAEVSFHPPRRPLAETRRRSAQRRSLRNPSSCLPR